ARRVPTKRRPESAGSMDPVPSMHRWQMLRSSGVELSNEETLPKHASIRQSRRECGCSCVGGLCLSESCECAAEGIPCQVDKEDDSFPCQCRAETCQNDHGRLEFDAQRVSEHYLRTFARMTSRGGQSDNTRGPSSATRVTSRDGEAQTEINTHPKSFRLMISIPRRSQRHANKTTDETNQVTKSIDCSPALE
ncbi:hypothetical protein PMAYCL1PPCAC_01139, partial [Pristionchus mayeri]